MKLFNKSVIISLIINLFHYYAFGVYAFSSVILAPHFFHTESEELTKVLGILTLSVTLLFKPLGSLLLSHIGDKYGRKNALITSLCLITVSTLCIGLLPTYASIGWMSGLLLLSCLFFQGLCIGGQYTGALIYIQEHTKRSHATLACSILVAIGILGVLLATGSTYLFHHFLSVGWDWRFPFLLTGLIGPVLFYYATQVSETPAFLNHKSKMHQIRIPLFEILRNYKSMIFSTICLACIPVSLFYFSTVYVPNFLLMNDDPNKAEQVLTISIMAQGTCMIFNPLLGYIADKFGKDLILKIASFLMIFLPIIFFNIVFFLNNFYAVLSISLVFAIFATFYAGPATAYLSEKFPIIGKYSGLGLGISIGESFGALGPIICVSLGELYESKLASLFFIMSLGFIGLMGLLISSKKEYIEQKALVSD